MQRGLPVPIHTQPHGPCGRYSDGDTLPLLDATNTQHKIRLASIDSPENGQRRFACWPAGYILRTPDSCCLTYPVTEAIAAQKLALVQGWPGACVLGFRHGPCRTFLQCTNKNSPLDQGAVQNQTRNQIESGVAASGCTFVTN